MKRYVFLFYLIFDGAIFGIEAKKVDPKAIFDSEIWYHARGLCVCDWIPLDIVKKNEQCENVLRMITADGWLGTWSITLCENLVPDVRHDYRKTGRTIHLQYRARAKGPDFTIIHRISANEIEAGKVSKIFRQIPFNSASPWNDFDLPRPGGADKAIFIFEKLQNQSYSVWCRQNQDNVPEEILTEVSNALLLVRKIFSRNLAGLPKQMQP